jgi:Ca2+-binding RTX toxin-like protein
MPPAQALSSAQMSLLEPRRLLSAAYPTPDEQYLVELINRGRADPSAEAQRYGIDLNEGLSPGTISTSAKQPLAINPYLTDSARGHSQWMIDTDTFSHTGVNGTDPGTRMSNAGYVFTGSWTWGENIAERGSSGSINTDFVTAQIHSDLFIDSGIEGRGHRTNLMNPAYREIGAGVVTGDFNGYSNSLMGTEDFAASGSSSFLTGVAYHDSVTRDNFYTPGEGLGGINITATRISDSQSFSTTTWSSGGYSLALPAGTYSIVGTGAALGTVSYGNVVIASQNVKEDFTPAPVASFASLSHGKLTVDGTDGVDAISIVASGSSYVVTRTGVSTSFPSSSVTSIEIYSFDGDDYISIGPGVIGCYMDAGAGFDYLVGGDGPDTMTGGASKDTLFGGLGDDRLNGNGGHDQLHGEAGKDRLSGGAGNDTLDGGSSMDRFWDDSGNNTFYGQGGDDRIFARNGLADVIYGQKGTDHAQVDQGLDTVVSIEDLLA